MDALKIGRTNGLYFGIIGFVVGVLIFTSLLGGGLNFVEYKNIISGIVLITVFLLFSVYFGGRAAKQILKKGKNALFTGAISSIKTLALTVIVSAPLIGLIHGISLERGLESIIIYLIYSILFGGIPAILIGMLFGSFVKSQIG